MVAVRFSVWMDSWQPLPFSWRGAYHKLHSLLLQSQKSLTFAKFPEIPWLVVRCAVSISPVRILWLFPVRQRILADGFHRLEHCAFELRSFFGHFVWVVHDFLVGISGVALNDPFELCVVELGS